ncbi:MAG: glycosyltransferase family protein [Clostridium sp.]
MNEKIISFLLCVNDLFAFRNCKIFLENLIVPDGFEIEVLHITEAKSMTNGYNQLQKIARGKYKVYMHQDVFITNPHFIPDTLNIFKDENIGAIAMVGSKLHECTPIWWDSNERYGRVFEFRHDHLYLLSFDIPESNYTEVDLVDGLMLITQYDTPWRDDLFDGWHFYDASQCMEIKKLNKKIVVPKLESPWCIHDCGNVSMDGFNYYKQVFLNEYAYLLDELF